MSTVLSVWVTDQTKTDAGEWRTTGHHEYLTNSEEAEVRDEIARVHRREADHRMKLSAEERRARKLVYDVAVGCVILENTATGTRTIWEIGAR